MNRRPFCRARVGNRRFIDDVLDAVMHLTPQPAGPSVTETNPFGANPPVIREWGLVIAWPVARAMPSPFFSLMGFEFVHIDSDVILESDAWDAFQHAIARHDKPQIDTLLITVGAPIEVGFTFPSDLLVARLALKKLEAGATITPNHLTEILVHQWEMRSIYRVTPGRPGYELVTWDPERLQGHRGRWVKRGEFKLPSPDSTSPSPTPSP